MTRIGVFMNLPKGDAEAEARIRGLRQGLENLGHNDLEIECRYGAGTEHICRKNAKELVDLNPAVIHAASGVMLDALQQEMNQAGRTIPIVFAGVIDPVGTRKIASLERPGGNATGCASILFNIGAKWLALLKFIAPGLTRAAVIRDGTTLAGRGQFNAVAGAAKTLGVRLNPVDVGNASEIEQAITSFADQTDCGLIVTAGSLAGATRQQIINLARQHRVPAVHPNRMYATDGGLIAYGPITVELYRSAAGYVDRIVKHHAKPADLPVQQPAKYELDINLQTARAIGLNVPPALLIFADRVIE
jgi:putative ABC transport system substrate-binding protein